MITIAVSDVLPLFLNKHLDIIFNGHFKQYNLKIIKLLFGMMDDFRSSCKQFPK